MGNAACSRRMRQEPIHSPQLECPNPPVAPGSHVPSDHNDIGEDNAASLEARRHSYPQGLLPSNGQYFMGLHPGAVHPHLPQGVMPSSLKTPVVEEKVLPIRSEVNVNKSTFRLEKDPENPGYYLVTFTFDAIVCGSICIFFHAKEGHDFSLIPMKRELFEPVRIPFKKGLAQKFVQAPGSGVNLSAFGPSDLLQVTDDEVYPLVVRAETLGKELSTIDSNQEPGAPLMKSVGAQTTSCVLHIKDNEYCARVIKQIIWVEGQRYELQEIYGIETVDGGGGIDSSDFGKECVICLSEPRNTAVLPCRHMCMCGACAKLLQQRTNRCPICRTLVVKLLEIEVPNREATST